MNTEQLQQAARIALASLDLTTLNNHDTEADVERLCRRAQGAFGQVAAVCVWPRLAGYARNRLPDSIRVAAVANFPDGYADVERAVRDTREIVAAGAQEVDLVLPWQHVLRGDDAAALKVMQATREACPDLTLKVILETGMLLQHEAIARASRLALKAGADFLKTSTGKTTISATPEAARLMLEAIRQDPAAEGRVGFKPSGGIRTVSDAATYIELTRSLLGEAALSAERFRIGASSVLDDIERVLSGEASHSSAAPGVY
ncbi:deoxyribose-phosphate aldolase [Uliginosibacterium sp. 31-12]|uniref:deoxyribose-phosphate aldolase n=1 Tax=Uliginosibacterium sp. 31-12 TaxID=3062781 RepID=UPI0026E36A85|nr:deoxyribose-phosphate aldolase [Uliginosibacterium sp. 31-12]MDO6387706.1 deoxyribose-phosphate aldolase [Uliginosibacterium sp. 31-12]